MVSVGGRWWFLGVIVRKKALMGGRAGCGGW